MKDALFRKLERSKEIRVSGKKLHRLRDFAYSNCCFYIKFHEGFENSLLNELQIFTKKAVYVIR